MRQVCCRWTTNRLDFRILHRLVIYDSMACPVAFHVILSCRHHSVINLLPGCLAQYYRSIHYSVGSHYGSSFVPQSLLKECHDLNIHPPDTPCILHDFCPRSSCPTVACPIRAQSQSSQTSGIGHSSQNPGIGYSTRDSGIGPTPFFCCAIIRRYDLIFVAYWCLFVGEIGHRFLRV